MTRPAWMISAFYLSFAVIYYLISSLLFASHQKPGSNVLQSLVNALADMFYWINVHYYFLLTIFVSALAGLLVSSAKKWSSSFKVFRNILIGEIVLVTLLIIFSNI